ncbi:hypothetical protein EDD16DRAFT_1703986 [Pisolithus croceorrhizus]|nr:hypothetical protein EDD16DRAFT_1703986 [Pisolithus croceorrhizus]KAI6164172.1 hypothetical protein EDD17DRAFT_1806259 [Pisolithus thermaeus]
MTRDATGGSGSDVDGAGFGENISCNDSREDDQDENNTASFERRERSHLEANAIYLSHRLRKHVSANSAPAEVGKGVDATSEPFNRVGHKKVVGGGDIVGSLTFASKEGVATQQALDRMTGQPHATSADFQRISESVLQILRAFLFVVTTFVKVEPNVQVALGILAIAAQLLINQGTVGSEVSDLLDAVRIVYEFLMKQDTIKNILKETLGKIALVTMDAVQFITSHSDTESWNKMAENFHSETQAIISGYVKPLNNLMQRW